MTPQERAMLSAMIRRADGPAVAAYADGDPRLATAPKPPQGPAVATPKRVSMFDQFFNGTGIPERLQAAHSLFNPVTGLQDAGQAATSMLAPGRAPTQRISDAGKMLTGMAGTVAPMWAASRGAVPTANAMVDALTGINMPGGEFLVDEFGGVRLPGGGIRAYHGSPHSFDRFSMDKIGTGEGAQAYGHGLYFAENEGVAREYRDALTAPVIDGRAPDMQDARDVATFAVRLSGDRERAIASLQKQRTQAAQDAAEYLRNGGELGEVTKPPGSMYEVRINANPDDFLDWDKPLSEQPAKVREAIVAQRTGGDPLLAELFGGDFGADENMLMGMMPNAKGAAAYKTIAGDIGGEDAAAKALREKGVAGIRYLDAGSRGAGDGSRNYVVFDENLIEIVRKYGIAGAAAVLGMNAADVEAAVSGKPAPNRNKAAISNMVRAQ